MAQSLYVLFEEAVGYGLFVVKEFDEMALLAPKVEECVLDLGKFNSLVQVVHYHPFTSSTQARENLHSIAEGEMHDDLKVLLVEHVPKSGKKLKVKLGVGDTRLAGVIQLQLDISCLTTGVVPEILRGIKVHFSSMVKDGHLTEQVASRARLGMGHSFSRDKVQFNVNRVDNMIIQSIALLDQLDKDINTFAMRIREWYSYHFPELVKIVPDNYLYAKVVKVIKDRKEMPEDSTQLEEILMDSAKAQAVMDAARLSMGMDISLTDLKNVQALCTRVIDMAEMRQQMSQYLISRMKCVAPNLAALIGDQVGARLIAHAGSLTNLAKCPASTVQILGAEKALFRALKTRGNTPKYGLIFHSTFIGRADAKNKGRISRYLANKCSIASRIDCFGDTPSSIFGDHLRQQVEDRMTFFQTGDTPAKNIDVMQKALAELTEFELKEKKKKKKDKKRKLDDSQAESGLNDTQESISEEGEPKKKKKKKQKQDAESEAADSMFNDTMESVDGEEPTKKKKKKVKPDTEDSSSGIVTGEETPSKKEKKKKRKSSGGDE